MGRRPRTVSRAFIEQLQQALADTPECRSEEITRTEAIRMLAPQIHKMQSKGYGYTAIAALLSEKGFAVTSKGLKTYLREAKGAVRKRPLGKEKQGQHANGGGFSDRSENQHGIRTRQDSGPRAAPESSATESSTRRENLPGIATGPSPLPAARPALPRQASAPGDANAQRRSAFIPRKDREEI
jgi:hypothetical protein